MRNRELIKAARELVEEDTEAVIRRHRDECCCPNNVTYVIFTNCLPSTTVHAQIGISANRKSLSAETQPRSPKGKPIAAGQPVGSDYKGIKLAG